MAEKKGIPEEVRQYLAVELGKPVVTICTGKPNAPKLEVVDVECFPAERESDEPTWQLSNPEDGKPWLIVNQPFVELMAKLPKLEAPYLPTSVDRLPD